MLFFSIPRVCANVWKDKKRNAKVVCLYASREQSKILCKEKVRRMRRVRRVLDRRHRKRKKKGQNRESKKGERREKNCKVMWRKSISCFFLFLFIFLLSNTNAKCRKRKTIVRLSSTCRKPRGVPGRSYPAAAYREDLPYSPCSSETADAHWCSVAAPPS